MATLTSEQSIQLAEAYSNLAHEIDSYRFRNFSKITVNERSVLENRARMLRNFSSEFIAISISLDLTDLTGTLEKIERATGQMGRTIKKLNRIENIINILTSVVTLAGSIITGSPAGVLDSLDGIADSVKSAKQDEAV